MRGTQFCLSDVRSENDLQRFVSHEFETGVKQSCIGLEMTELNKGRQNHIHEIWSLEFFAIFILKELVKSILNMASRLKSDLIVSREKSKTYCGQFEQRRRRIARLTAHEIEENCLCVLV